MKYLLDTHLLLWAIAGDRRLPARLRTLLAEDGAEACFSAASVWEVAIKNGIPRRITGTAPLRSLTRSSTIREKCVLASNNPMAGAASVMGSRSFRP